MRLRPPEVSAVGHARQREVSDQIGMQAATDAAVVIGVRRYERDRGRPAQTPNLTSDREVVLDNVGVADRLAGLRGTLAVDGPLPREGSARRPSRWGSGPRLMEGRLSDLQPILSRSELGDYVHLGARD